MQMSWEDLWNTVWCSAYRSEKTLFQTSFGGLNGSGDREHLNLIKTGIGDDLSDVWSLL